MKKTLMIFIIVVSSAFLFGCSEINLTEEEEAAYIEYAVNAVINHDNNYMMKLKKVEPETEPETEWISDDKINNGSSQENGNSSEGNNNTDTEAYSSFTEALGVTGLEANVTDVKECASYPEYGRDELGFSLTAVSGSRLAVVEIEVKNTTASAITLDTREGYSFKGVFNNISRTNAQVTFLDNALNSNTCIIEANQSKTLVLIYELNKEKLPEINKFVLSITHNEHNYNVSIK